jgi:drug/metabolite transporter (DMT)-like permease
VFVEALLAGWTFIHQDRYLYHHMLFVAARMLGGFMCMCLGYPVMKNIFPRLQFRSPTMEELGDITVLATVGITMSETLYCWGLAATSSAFAATYEATLPIFTIFLALACSQEKTSIAVAFSIICAALGTVFLAQKTPQFSKAEPSPDMHAMRPNCWGHVMLIASYAFKAAFLILLRRFHRRHSEYETFVGIRSTRSEGPLGAYCLTFWILFITVLQAIVVLLVNGQMAETITVGLNSSPELVYGMIFISAVCPCVITWANMKMGRSTSVAIFACAHPLFVVCFADMYPDNPFQLVGAILVLLGLYRNVTISSSADARANSPNSGRRSGLHSGLPTLVSSYSSPARRKGGTFQARPRSSDGGDGGDSKQGWNEYEEVHDPLLIDSPDWHMPIVASAIALGGGSANNGRSPSPKLHPPAGGVSAGERQEGGSRHALAGADDEMDGILMDPPPFPPPREKTFAEREAAEQLQVLPESFLLEDEAARSSLLSSTVSVSAGDANAAAVLLPAARCMLQEVLQLSQRYHDQQGHWDLVIGEWGWHERFGVIRKVTYMCKTNAPVGPQETRMVEIERYVPCTASSCTVTDGAGATGADTTGGDDGDDAAPAAGALKSGNDFANFRIQAAIFALDAQFGDRFYIETELRLRTDAAKCTVSIDKPVGVRFLKSVPFFQGIIQSEVMKKNKIFSGEWHELMTKQLQRIGGRG